MPVIFDGNFRGLADSKFSGILGSFARSTGIDGHSTPGSLKIHQQLAKDSASTVDALVRVRIVASDGSTLWFSYTSGKIWRRTSSGTWTLEHTTTPAAGGAGCLGAEEFDGYIYWATESRLHRKTITDLSDWSGGVTEDWATFTNTDSEFHPMVKQNLQLFIGDANYVAKVSGDTGSHAFKANALDLKSPIRIKTMIDFDIDILIGTFIHANVNFCEVIRWDTEDDSWLSSDSIEENGINAFIRDDNFVYVNAGRLGRIYFYDGEKLVPFKRIPGNVNGWSSSETAEIYPQAVSTFLTIPVFGLSSGNQPADLGVYGFGSYSKDYPKVLSLYFPISNGLLSNIEVGAILAVGTDLLVAWKSGANTGVDVVDTTGKYSSAFIETTVLTGVEERHFLKTVLKIFANYSSLPANTAINFKYKKKHEASFGSAVTVVKDTKLMQVRAEISVGEVAAFEIRVEFTTNSNNGPEVESIGYELNTEK